MSERYPNASDIGTYEDGAMIFRAQPLTFRLSRADNGVIFEEYQVATDEIRRLVAVSPEQLTTIFDQWCAEKRQLIERCGAAVFAAKEVETV